MYRGGARRHNAEHYSHIIGTEEDKENCPYYFKIGACRHGDICKRRHLRPALSQTLMFPHMYSSSQNLEEFYEDLIFEMSQYGELENICVVDNLGDHLLGCVWVKFRKEEQAEAVLEKFTGRKYYGVEQRPEFSPVTDFSLARCRQLDEGKCRYGGMCNYMHIKTIPQVMHELMRE